MSLLVSNPSVSTVPPTPPSTGFTPGTDLGRIPLLSTISMNSHSVSTTSLWETDVTSNGRSHPSSPAHSHYSDLCEAPSSGFDKDIWSFVFDGMMVPCLANHSPPVQLTTSFRTFNPRRHRKMLTECSVMRQPGERISGVDLNSPGLNIAQPSSKQICIASRPKMPNERSSSQTC